MHPETAIRRGGDPDVAAVARLHRDQLTESFLSSLGEAFLQVLYRRIVADPASTVLVAVSGDDVVGFISGTESTGQLYRSFVRHDAVRAATAAAGQLLRHPRTTVETLRYGGGGSGGPSDLPAAELLSLAVAPSARRTGVGSRLIAGLQDHLGARGVDRMRVTVAADNAAAISAYRRSGFEPAAVVELHRGRSSQVLVWG